MAATIIPLATRRPEPLPGNAIRSKRLKLQDFPAEDEHMQRIYACWHAALHLHCGMPTRKDVDLFDHLDLFKPSMGYLHIIDCDTDDPANYSFRLYGSGIQIFQSKNFTHSRLSDIPCLTYRQEIMADYHTVRESGTPSLHVIKTRLDWYTTMYSRLVLPLSQNRRDVTQLLVAVHRRPVPELGDLPW